MMKAARLWACRRPTLLLAGPGGIQRRVGARVAVGAALGGHGRPWLVTASSRRPLPGQARSSVRTAAMPPDVRNKHRRTTGYHCEGAPHDPAFP